MMREILEKAKTVRELLKGVKYSIDYYQREYKWQDKQIYSNSRRATPPNNHRTMLVAFS